MNEMHHNEPNQLCEEFAKILDATPSIINGVCTATRSRTNIHPTVLGRKAESFMFVPQAFSFENMDYRGRALCLGETVVLEEEVNPFISKLEEAGIVVTALHNHWLFDNPKLLYIHFQDIDEPLKFAKNVRNALKVLTNKNVGITRGERENLDDKAKELCEKFHNILGGTHTFEDGVCMVMDSRLNIVPRVMGRLGRSFLLIPQMFAFESLTSDGSALCSGESVILQEEFNPLAAKLREKNILITAFHNHWLFDDPRLMYIHFLKIDNPANFAKDVKNAFRVLTDRFIRA